jgi:hypothetical protein
LRKETKMIAAAQSIATGSGPEQAYFETSPDLLSAVAEALDIRSVLPRVSKIANALVPHDALVLAFVDSSGELVVHSTAAGLPYLEPDTTGTPLAHALIVADLRTEAMAATWEHPRRRVLAAGYRALMSVTARAREQLVSLQFWSKRPCAFGWGGVPMAQRVAEHLAVGVAHEALVRARVAAAEASIRPSVDRTGGAAAHRAPAPPVHVATPGHTRVVGESAPGRMVLTMATQVAATDAQSGNPCTRSGPTVAGAMPLKCGSTLQPAFTRIEVTKHETHEVHDRIDAELHTVGLAHFSQAIAQRMELIEMLAVRFNNDSRAIRRICLEVMDRISSTLEPALRPTLHADSKRDMSIAAYLHDIGKSGPFDASPETQEAIVKLYAVENVPDPAQTIAESVRANFSFEEADSILAHLNSCGMRSVATMRAFWDCHGYWTHDILETDSEHIPARARVVAGSHHMDRGIDPYACATSDYVDLLESRILMAVDKYQAAIVRGRKTHDDAMNLITRMLSPKFGNDVIMNRVLNVVDQVGSEVPWLAEAA